MVLLILGHKLGNIETLVLKIETDLNRIEKQVKDTIHEDNTDERKKHVLASFEWDQELAQEDGKPCSKREKLLHDAMPLIVVYCEPELLRI